MDKNNNELSKHYLECFLRDDNFNPNSNVYRKTAGYFNLMKDYGNELVVLGLFFLNEPKCSKSRQKWFFKKLMEVNMILNTSYRPRTFKNMTKEDIRKLSEQHKKENNDQLLKNHLIRFKCDDNFNPPYAIYKESAKYYHSNEDYGNELVIIGLFFLNNPKTNHAKHKWFSKKLGEINTILNSVYRPYKFQNMTKEEIRKLSKVRKKEIIDFNSPTTLSF